MHVDVEPMGPDQPQTPLVCISHHSNGALYGSQLLAAPTTLGIIPTPPATTTPATTTAAPGLPLRPWPPLEPGSFVDGGGDDLSCRGGSVSEGGPTRAYALGFGVGPLLFGARGGGAAAAGPLSLGLLGGGRLGSRQLAPKAGHDGSVLLRNR
jgi:hypothetical protein